MTHRLVDFLSRQQELNMEEQEQALITELEEWQGNQPQIDDIILVEIELLFNKYLIINNLYIFILNTIANEKDTQNYTS